MKECKRFEKLLPGYLHGELYERDYHALRAHLESCASCRAELEVLNTTFRLAGKVMAAVPTPVRMSAWRHLPVRKVDIRTNAFARIWVSPQFKAALVTGVIAALFIMVSMSFVMVQVVQKSEVSFEAAPVQRPRMKLNKLQVSDEIKATPKLRRSVVVKPKVDVMDDYSQDFFGAEGGHADKDVPDQTFAAAAVERPKMMLKKPKVKVVKSAQPKPSSRIVAKVKTRSMPEIQMPDLEGTSEGLIGGTGLGSAEIVDRAEISETSVFGYAVSTEPEPATESVNLSGYSTLSDSDTGRSQDKNEQYAYGDPFANEPTTDTALPQPVPAVGKDNSIDGLFAGAMDAGDSMDDLFGGEDLDAYSTEPWGRVADNVITPDPSETKKSAKKIPDDVSRARRSDFKDEAAVTPRERKPAVFNPYVMAADNAFSTFSIDVDTASYGLARQLLLGGAMPDTEAVRTEEFINSFDYDYRPPAGKQTFAVHSEMAPSPFRGRMDVLKVGIKGRRIGRDDHRKAILTLVIDTSGSMSTPERLGLVKQSLSLLLDHLDPEDKVAIVQFGGDARLVCEHTPVSNKADLLAAINALHPGGPTQFDKGLELGYLMASDGFEAGDSNRIIIMSDGVANLGELDPDAILEQVADYRTKGIYLSVLGFGAGTYDDDLLERLANRGDGMYAYVDTMDEARQLFVDRLASTLHVIASDVKIQIEFNPDRVLRYRQLGYENRQLTKEQFRDDTVDAGEVGSGQSVTALYDVELKPDGLEKDPIATVYVRYRRADNGAIEEISSRVMDSYRKARFEDADARFQLAACVAEFAERLRRSPYTEGTEMTDVLARMQPVVLALNLDGQVQELQQLISIATGLEN